MQGFKHDRIFRDGGYLSYYFRTGPGPVLTLIPGSFNSAEIWQDVLPLLDADWYLVLIELRGHGASWPPPRHGSIEQFADDTLFILDTLFLDSFYIGGHSIGGMVALEVARRDEHRVKGVLCVEGWTNYHAEEDAFGKATPSYELPPAIAEKYRRVRRTIYER